MEKKGQNKQITNELNAAKTSTPFVLVDRRHLLHAILLMFRAGTYWREETREKKRVDKQTIR